MSDYKRLTNEAYDYEYNFCLGCRYCGEPNGCNRPDGECANYDKFCEIFKRLAELEDKIEQGKIIYLPQKIGTTIITFCPNCHYTMMYEECSNGYDKCPACGTELK